MAEEQVASSALVLQIEREKLLSKLHDLRMNNLNEEQQRNLSKLRFEFVQQFLFVILSLFSLSPKELRELNETEFKELDKLISIKARPWAICHILFTFGVPFVGWFFGAMLFDTGICHSWPYLRYRKRLMKAYGKDYFPFSELKQRLNI